MSQRKRIQSKALDLTDEFKQFQGHPKMAEIINGFFLYDGDLCAPSQDLIMMVTLIILRDPQMLKKLNEMEENEGMKEVIQKISIMKATEVADIALSEAKRQVSFSLIYDDDRQGEMISRWWLLIEVLRNSEESIDRLVAQKSIDLLTTRAVWHLDYESITALATATKECATGDIKSGRKARMIAGDIIYYEDLLESKLGKKPTKSEMKELLLGVSPFLSESDKVWSQAWRILGWNKKNDRHRKMDNSGTITRLILELNKEN